MADVPDDVAVLVVTAGDPARLTGGNLYNWHVCRALVQAGFQVVEVVLSSNSSEADSALAAVFPPNSVPPLDSAVLRLTAARPSSPPPPTTPAAQASASPTSAPRPIAFQSLHSFTFSRILSRMIGALTPTGHLLVILDSIAFPAASPLLPFLRDPRLRVVSLMHMLPSDLSPEEARPATRALEAAFLAGADGVVAVSPHLRECLIASGAATARVTVIPPGKDGVPLVSGNIRMRAEDGTCRFLCVANWSEAKAIHVLVEALASVPEAHLRLVGETGDGAYARSVLSLVEQLHLTGRVQVCGPLPAAALAAAYAAADVFVLPSISEGFGTVCAEAMFSGLPVIACRVGPLPWLVEDTCGLLVPPNNAKALAAAMALLAASPDLRRRMAAACLIRASRLPSWQETEARFVSFLQGLARS